ncbi:MAG TPA: hypothetical protein P5572_06265 [Phycisphaerae bacterium]|nr:hypothetical protein [Phycisphaerales bacterium]HRX84609.1 hypothetical protein [Phycisphaerae bacterium]
MIVLIGAAAWGAGAGCTRNTLQLVDMDLRSVPDAGPLVERITLDDCYWWQTQEGLAVAAARGPVRATGSPRKRVDLSFVFTGLPAGQSRNYLLNTESLRAYVRQGSTHRRYRSASGIAAVWLEPGGELRVKFRVLARRETFHILTGWSPAGETMLLGELQARHDGVTAQAILQRSEADGMNRTDRANTPVEGRPRPVQVFGPPVEEPQAPPPVHERGPNR